MTLSPEYWNLEQLDDSVTSKTCNNSVYLDVLHSEVGAVVLNKHVIFDESVGIEQQIDSFSGSEFTLK